MDMRLFSNTDGTNWTQVQDWTGLTYADDFKPGGTWTPISGDILQTQQVDILDLLLIK